MPCGLDSCKIFLVVELHETAVTALKKMQIQDKITDYKIVYSIRQNKYSAQEYLYSPCFMARHCPCITRSGA